MRLGIVLAGFASLPPAEFIAAAREAESRGYHTAWLGEVSGHDAIVLSTVVATHTERLVVANGVLPVQTRTPVIHSATPETVNRRIAEGWPLVGMVNDQRYLVSAAKAARDAVKTDR